MSVIISRTATATQPVTRMAASIPSPLLRIPNRSDTRAASSLSSLILVPPSGSQFVVGDHLELFYHEPVRIVLRTTDIHKAA